jgi:hypothetical protein
VTSAAFFCCAQSELRLLRLSPKTGRVARSAGWGFLLRYDLRDPTRLGAARGAPLPEDGEGFKHHAGAPDFTSLYTIESISAWNEASMILGDTPIVVQRSPSSSSLSMRTRVTASVPALRMRTR